MYILYDATLLYANEIVHAVIRILMKKIGNKKRIFTI